MNEKYGNLDSETQLERNVVCREIVKKIVEFGVAQDQLLFIIYLLAFELENHEQFVELVALTKELLSTTNNKLQLLNGG